MALEDILRSKLDAREPQADPAWTIWEHKTFNLHRGVVHWRPREPNVTLSTAIDEIRKQVTASYRRSWWRGFAFGALIELALLPDDISAIADPVDTRSASQGTWQWTVVVCGEPRIVVATHTWAEGYLTSIYRSLLAHYEALQYEVSSFKKEKDRLMQFVAAVSKLRGRTLAEFEP